MSTHVPTLSPEAYAARIQAARELADLLKPPTPQQPSPSRPFDLDAYWAERDRAREDEMGALGEPDRIDGWLVAGRRAIWGAA